MPLIPGQAVSAGLGTGTPIGPLSPASLCWVGASGMLANDDPDDGVTAADPGTDDRPLDTGKPTAGAVLQRVENAGLTSGGVVPPLSKTLLGLAGLGAVGTMPAAAAFWQTVSSNDPTNGAGLNPPVKSSLAASGIPEPPTGDIGSRVPSAGVVPGAVSG